MMLHDGCARARQLCPRVGSGRAPEREGITLDYLTAGTRVCADQWGGEALRGADRRGRGWVRAPDPAPLTSGARRVPELGARR